MVERDDAPRIDGLLVDGLLGEAAGKDSPPDVSEAVARRLETPPAPRNRWLTAAILLLGLGALAWIALGPHGSREPPPHDPNAIDAPQDPLPEPLPGALRVTSLRDAPDDARNLRLDVVGTGEGWFADIERLTRLERLEVRGARRGPAGPRNRGAKSVDDAALLHLQRCPTLHTLVLRDLNGVSAGNIRSLAAMAGLRSLELNGSNITFDPTLAAAVCELPRLTDLRLRNLRVTTEGLAGLEAAPSLHGLELLAPAGIDSEGLATVAALENLRHLALTYIDNAVNMLSGRHGMPTSFDLLDPEYLATLPALESLDLSDNLIFPDRVAALPKSLRHLSLATCHGLENGIEGFAAALLALPELKSLVFHTASPPSEFERLAKPGAEITDPEADILEAVLSSRLLERLTVRRYPAGAWGEALATQSLLRELRIETKLSRGDTTETLDLGFAAHLANLEVLILDVHVGRTEKRLDDLDFAPLTELPRLQRLHLPGWRARHVKRAREALGPDVAVWN